MMTKIRKYHGVGTDVNATLYSDGTLFVAGTGTTQDVKQDLKIFISIREEIKMHKGALEQAKELELLIQSELHLVKEIKAHSLGCGAGAYLATQYNIPAKLYGGFRPFSIFQRLPKADNIINYIYGTDIVPRIFFWRRFIGKVVRIKGSGFHPFTDHLRYKELDKYVGYMLEEL